MSRLGLVRPTSLLGQEIRTALEAKKEIWSEIRLLSTREEEIGTVTDVGGRAALVERLEPGSLAALDLVLLCDDFAHTEPVLSLIPPETAVVVASLDAPPHGLRSLVAGLNLGSEPVPSRSLSPHPAVVALGRLLQPVLDLEPLAVTATVVLPASVHGEAGLEEVFTQTRELLSFRTPERNGIFRGQIAFNLLPAPLPTELLGGQLRALLGDRPQATLQALQSGIFHGLSISLCLRFESDPGLATLRDALAASTLLELRGTEDDEDREVGPVDAASRSEILVGRLEEDTRWPGTFWLWSVADHLVLGAHNAVAISAAHAER